MPSPNDEVIWRCEATSRHGRGDNKEARASRRKLCCLQARSLRWSLTMQRGKAKGEIAYSPVTDLLGSYFLPHANDSSRNCSRDLMLLSSGPLFLMQHFFNCQPEENSTCALEGNTLYLSEIAERACLCIDRAYPCAQVEKI